METSCHRCPTYKSCIWSQLGAEQHERIRRNVNMQPHYERGRHLFHAGEPFRLLYILRSGSLKTWRNTEDGGEYIIRFYSPGHVVGLDAISTGIHHSTATMLESSSLCMISYTQLQNLADAISGINQLMLQHMSQEILQTEQLMYMRGNMSAAARLASFLYDLSMDYKARGYSAEVFNLTMDRGEIANHLGLAIETVSRTLSHFKHEGTLRVFGKQIEIKDKNRLMGYRRLPAGESHHEASIRTH